MKQQTPLRKAIAEIEKQIRDMTGADYVAGICINVIESLLPEERKVIETAHISGQKTIVDCLKESMPQIDLRFTYAEIDKGFIEGDVRSTDFFTSNFEQ